MKLITFYSKGKPCFFTCLKNLSRYFESSGDFNLVTNFSNQTQSRISQLSSEIDFSNTRNTNTVFYIAIAKLERLALGRYKLHLTAANFASASRKVSDWPSLLLHEIVSGIQMYTLVAMTTEDVSGNVTSHAQTTTSTVRINEALNGVVQSTLRFSKV